MHLTLDQALPRRSSLLMLIQHQFLRHSPSTLYTSLLLGLARRWYTFRWKSYTAFDSKSFRISAILGCFNVRRL